jgi:hypothetical protein
MAQVWRGWREAVVIVKPEAILASARLSALLDVEEPTPLRSTGCPAGRPPVDSHNGDGKSRNPPFKGFVGKRAQ